MKHHPIGVAIGAIVVVAIVVALFLGGMHFVGEALSPPPPCPDISEELSPLQLQVDKTLEGW